MIGFALVPGCSRSPEYRVGEEIKAEFGYVRKIYVGVPHGINPLPVRSGWPFHLPYLRLGLGLHHSKLSYAADAAQGPNANCEPLVVAVH